MAPEKTEGPATALAFLGITLNVPHFMAQLPEDKLQNCRTLITQGTQSKAIKPTFHQNAKYLASGTFASPDAKDSSFASPNARNTNMLVSLALGDTNFLRRPSTFLFFCVDFFTLGSQHEPHSQWNIGGIGCLVLGLCVGHVHFMCQVTQTLPNANPFLGGIWAQVPTVHTGTPQLRLSSHRPRKGLSS